MPKPRKAQICLDTTPYYHCVSRCVRRAFLCGVDSHSGHNFEHRRRWIEDRLQHLATIFAIDLCAYAVMSNHYHVVLHVDRERAGQWDTRAVIEHWHQLFKGTLLTQRYCRGDHLNYVERQTLEGIATHWRERLCDISWFMRVMNEAIARAANQEDGCTGRFWEGRYKSQALLDEKALAACMAYVDLNPIRAGMTDTPEHSDYTSVKLRAETAKTTHSPNHCQQQPSRLLPFAGNPHSQMSRGLPFRLTDYLELVDWTGRSIRNDKRGAICGELPPMLERLNIDPRHWLYCSRHFESRFKGLVGTTFALKRACEALGYRRTPGANGARLLS